MSTSRSFSVIGKSNLSSIYPIKPKVNTYQTNGLKITSLNQINNKISPRNLSINKKEKPNNDFFDNNNLKLLKNNIKNLKYLIDELITYNKSKIFEEINIIEDYNSIEELFKLFLIEYY